MATLNWSLQHKRDTAANWTSNNPTLLAGQLGIETDGLTTNPKFKVGDGATAWNSLPYFYGGASSAQNLNNVLSVGNATGAYNIGVNTGQYIYFGNTTRRIWHDSGAGAMLVIENTTSGDHILLKDSGEIHIDSTNVNFPSVTASRILALDASNNLTGAYTTTGSGTTLALSTSPTFVTNITTPLIIGGTAVGSALTYKSTTANGTSTGVGHNFVVGNNGNISAFSILNNGLLQAITMYFSSNINVPTVYGGTTASQDLTLVSTEHATKGRVLIGSSSIFNFDQTNVRLGIGVNPTASLHIKTAGGANFGLKIEATNASNYAPIDFVTPTGLAGQFLATSASFSSGIFSGNQLALASYVANGLLLASSYSIKFAAGGLATTNEAFSIDTNANLICGRAAIATNATNGFLYVPTCAGTPTGVPTTVTGRVPIVADSTNNKLYIHSGGAWVALN